MTPPAVGWADLLRSLGRAFQDLLRSEMAALGEELAGSGRRLAVIAGLFLVALFGLFWSVGLLVFVGVEVLSLWMPRWAAALAVFGAVLLLAGILWAVARRRIQRLESPATTVRRRVADHVEWWEARILGAAEPGGPEEMPGSDSEDRP